MATYIAKQLAARARRPAVPADVPILASQITAPGVPDWAVPRPRITKLIAQGRRWCRLTVITAPAGAGKTTALVVWAAAAPGTVAWITVDVCDNRPGVFWAHVVAALRRSGVAVPEALPATHGREAGHIFLLGLAAALAAQDPAVTLVLDDLHLLTGAKVLDGLDYVLRNTGSGLRLVVSARMDPLPQHRYRLAGELTEIRASDLAFTVAEAGLLPARHGCTLTADSLECLTRQTEEGWAAGSRLAAVSMETHPDQIVTRLITDDNVLTGYLVAEVLTTQPPEVRGRLCRAAQLAAGATAASTTDEQRAPGCHPNPAALAALAWVHPEHNELREAHSLTQADTALGVTPDKLIDAVAHLATSTAVTTERSNPCAAGSRTRAHPSCSPMCSTPRPIR